MNSKSVYKIPKGKLLKISLDYNENNKTINNVIITGDFFAYPEEAVEVLEKNLVNIKIEEESLLNEIKTVIKKNKYRFIGLNPEGLTKAILMCLK